MRTARTTTLALLALGACDAGVPASPERGEPVLIETRDFGGGSRLRARAWVTDGAFVLRHFFDVARGEACAFVEGGFWHVGPGPSYYCLPLGMALHDAVGTFAIYEDRRCTVPLALSPATGPATYALSRPIDACAAAPSIYRTRPSGTLFPFVLDGTSCVRSRVEIPNQALGDPVSLDDFVRAEERVVERGSRVASLVAVTGDGARQTIGAFDRERSEAVRIEDLAGAPLRWVPARVAFDGAGAVLFRDAACTATVPTKTAVDAICPLTAVLRFEGECSEARFHALGPPLSRTELHDRDVDTCKATNADGVLAFELGPPIEPSALAPAYVVEVGGASIRRRGFTGAGGEVVFWRDLVAAASGEPCAPETAIDGTQRCLPVASVAATLFADDACTTPAFAQPVSTCDRATIPRFVRSVAEAGTRVFEVTGEATTLYELGADVCRVHVPPVQSRGFALREVDGSRFPPAEERELP